jgi:hypothetical protein
MCALPAYLVFLLVYIELGLLSDFFYSNGYLNLANDLR